MVKEIVNYKEVLDVAPLLESSLAALNNPHKARMNLTVEELFQCAFYVAFNPDALFLVDFNLELEPVGYGLAFDTTNFWQNAKTLLVYIVYSKNDNPETIQRLLNYCERWCKENGYDYITAFTRRINGASSRWFERKLGFKKDFMVFTKEV